jgi:hypothetical protein
MPTLPAAAQQPTRAGAEAFLRHFLAVYSYSFRAVDSEALGRLSDPDCKFCRSAIESVMAGGRAGQRTLGGNLTVTTIIAAPGDPMDRLIVNAIVDQEPGRIVQFDGTVVRSVEARNSLHIDAAVRWVDGRWVMVDAQVADPAQQ